MKCPLLRAPGLVDRELESHAVFNCLKGECAWWDKERESCAIRLIPVDLCLVTNALLHIANKMPYEE